MFKILARLALAKKAWDWYTRYRKSKHDPNLRADRDVYKLGDQDLTGAGKVWQTSSTSRCEQVCFKSRKCNGCTTVSKAVKTGFDSQAGCKQRYYKS